MKISYCIAANDEAAELEGLLRHLKKYIRVDDEVIIQLDTSATTAVKEVCNLYTNFNHTGTLTTSCIANSKWYEFALNGDFAAFKNNFFNHASGDYIFNIDADEIPSHFLLENIHEILSSQDVDLIWVPRINTVSGLTDEHVKKWGWRVNEKGWVNWPDYQSRIYKNNDTMSWSGKVHERIVGFKKYARLPDTDSHLVLHHPKTISKQELQNKFYETL